MLNEVKSTPDANTFLTAGELAKLAGTTKRTILWYDQLGILKPVKVSLEGYRYYTQSQVLDYQMVLLMTTLGISLGEIKACLTTNNTLGVLFLAKRGAIKQQIDTLTFNLKCLDGYMKNLGDTKTLVKPEIKTMAPFAVYYIEKVGAYVNIGGYCSELASMFARKGKNFTTLAIFESPTYQPKKSPIKIAALANKGLQVKPKYKDVVKHMRFDPGKVITYTHIGKGELLSLFWKELEKYCRLNRIIVRHDIPDFEIYRKVSNTPSKQVFEIYLPVK